MALSQTTVLKVYNAVIEDVIGGVRDCFLDDGVDEQVLQELKQLWESKLMASKAIEVSPEPSELHPPPIIANSQKANGNKSGNTKKNAAVHHNNDSHNNPQPNSTVSHTNMPNSNAAHQNAQIHPNPASMPLDLNNKVPIQLTLPAQAGVPGSQPKVFTIQIPASALQGNQLHRILSGPFIASTLQLPQQLAATLLQQHITAALLANHNQSSESGGGGGGNKSLAPFQLDGACDMELSSTSSSNSIDTLECPAVEGAGCSRSRGPVLVISKSRRRPKICLSLDGALDSSDDEQPEEMADGSDVNDEDDDDDDVDDDDDGDGTGVGGSGDDDDGIDGGAEDEPLNSGDDVSEEDPIELFETDNVVVCQYDKITRSRNKWKFYLKDGIMNLSGKDFVFQKANGDAEW